MLFRDTKFSQGKQNAFRLSYGQMKNIGTKFMMIIPVKSL